MFKIFSTPINYLFTLNLQTTPRSAPVTQPCIPTEAKRETEEILNAILPPKEWEEDGQIWTQKVFLLSRQMLQT